MISSNSRFTFLVLTITVSLSVNVSAKVNSLICQQKDLECDQLINSYILQFQTIDEIDNEITNLNLIKEKVEKIMND